MTDDSLPRLLLNVGKGRSGSTLLDQAVGKLPSTFAAGELTRLWGEGLGGSRRCSCGEPFARCPVWSEVLASAFGTVEAASARARDIAAVQRRLLRWPRIPGLLAGRGGADLATWTGAAVALYRAIRAVTGASVVVESWVTPAHPGAYGLLPGIETFVLQRLRDPRAVAHSWQRVKLQPDMDDAPLGQHAKVSSAASWIARNAMAEVARRRAGADHSLVVRYEDFVADPGATVTTVATLIGVPPDVSFIDGHRMRLAPNHMVGGNPSRLGGAEVLIEADEEWRSRRPTAGDRITSLVTAPWRRRYGY